jgi:WD40 repeat protein
MHSAAADRNLLFGILALQMDFISRDQLVAAMHAWVVDKARPLGQILLEQGALSRARSDLLDALVEEHLRQHGQDPERSLAALAVPTPLRQELRGLADGDLDASLARLPDDPGRTAAYQPPDDGTPRYRVLRPHARGGLGEVFVALDGELQREVALKEIDARHAADAGSRGRFVQEAEITGKLEHPGVVPVYGLGRHADGRPFYAMRFIKGQTLKEAIARFHAAPTDGERTAELGLRGLLGRFVAVCNTVAYAHSRGVIHRDLKPANVMLGPYGETLVVDWGLAKAVGSGTPTAGLEEKEEAALLPQLTDELAETQAGTALGTPAYMSPEQAAGRLDQLGPASDIYSLGATLYTLLTGRPPIEGKDTAEVLRKAQKGEVAPPRRVRPGVPAALEAACLKALALRPEDRYGSAQALAADVERWLADEPVSAWPEPWGLRVRRWGRRHRALVTAALAALAVSLVGLTAGLILLGAAAEQEAKARHTAEEKEAEARGQRDEAWRRGEERRRVLYAAHLNLVQREYEAGNLAHVHDLLEQYRSPPADAEDLRGFEWHYWDWRAHRELRVLRGHKGPVQSVAFSPDGRLASGGADGTVRLWDAADGRELQALKEKAPTVRSVAWSPDGHLLASATREGGAVRLWDAVAGREVRTLRGHRFAAWGVAFSPDGRRLASAGSDGSDDMVRLWDVASGREVRALKGHKNHVRSVAWSPDGRRLASAGDDGTVRLWDAAGGEPLLILSVQKGWVFAVAWSPDGRRLASAGMDGTLRLWDAAGGRELHSLKGHQGTVFGVAFSPDGRRLASAGWDGTLRLWDAAGGRELLTLRGHTLSVNGVAFSPDGRRLASAGQDGTVRLWDAAASQERPTFKGHTGWVAGVAFSANGKRLASASFDGRLRLWYTETTQPLLTLEGQHGSLRGVAWSPDGRRLAGACGDGTVRLWDAAHGEKLLTLQGHMGEVLSVAWGPEGRRLAAAGENGTVHLWDAADGREVRTLKGHTKPVWSVAFSPDGKRLASAGLDQTVRVWDARTGQDPLTLQGHGSWITSVSWSPDGRRLAGACGDGTLRLWDLADGREVLTLKGHLGPVYSVAFSPDGPRLASAGEDGTVRLWDAARGQELLTLKGHTGTVTSVAFSPDGKRLASAGGDGMVTVWEASVSAPDLRRRELVSLVQERLDRLGLRSEVLAGLQKDPTLAASERAFALGVVQAAREDPVRCNNLAWEAVKVPGRDRETYALALRQVQAALQAEPGNGNWLNTLGVAHHRLGDYTKALQVLQRSEKLNATKEGSDPWDLAFLAMSRYRLGQTEQAQATLRRLREVMRQPRWANDAERQGFLREAEHLLQGKGKESEK